MEEEMLKLTTTNRELILLIKEDDRRAFLILYERYNKRLYAFIIKYLKQQADTEEIVQEVFTKVWEYRNKIDINSSFDSFMFTIAYNAVITQLRKKVNEKKYLEHLKTNYEFQTSSAITENIHYNELNHKLNILLENLTPRQKEIFKLSREEGMTHQEIAQKLGISLYTVKKHMVNTLAFLRSHMNNPAVFSDPEMDSEERSRELLHQFI